MLGASCFTAVFQKYSWNGYKYASFHSWCWT